MELDARDLVKSSFIKGIMLYCNFNNDSRDHGCVRPSLPASHWNYSIQDSDHEYGHSVVMMETSMCHLHRVAQNTQKIEPIRRKNSS